MSSNLKLSLEQINQKILKINEEYEKVFRDPRYKSPLLNNRSRSLLAQTIYAFVQNGDIIVKQKNKQLFLTLFRSYIKNFLQQRLSYIYSSHIITQLEKTASFDDFQDVLVQRWKHFKIFTFFHFFLLQSSANSFYQNAFFSSLQMGVHSDLNSEQSVFPIPAVALNLFKNLVFNKFQQKIINVISKSIKGYRKQMKQRQQNLRYSLQLIWACGLSELGRFRLNRGQIDFYKQQRNQFVKEIKVNHEQFFSNKILNHILRQTEIHYIDEYQNKILPLFPIEQFKAIKSILQREFQFSHQFLLTKEERKQYMNKIYSKLVLNGDLQERLKTIGSFKHLIAKYRFNSEEGFQDIKIFFDIIKSSHRISESKFRAVIKPIEIIFSQIILQQGKQINQKINKRRQYISDMLILKRSIQKLLEEFVPKNVILFSIKDKSFKKILDSIQASRNLADFTDFTIKQCIRLKLDQQRCLQKFSDVFLLLNSITSTDSFLLYHQQLLSKRIVETLNQPKLEYQILMLKKLSQRMGVMSVSTHMSMIKDIQLSQQMTQKYNNRLPFSSFKWNLKIFNPSYWPQNINRQKVNIQIPNCLLHQIKAVEQLYHQQNQYRYLNWKLQKGTSLFQGKFQAKKIRFQSQNSYLMVLLSIAEQPNHKIIYGNLKQIVRSQKNQAQNKHDSLAMLLYVLIENRLILRSNVQDKYSPFSESQQLQINKKYTTPQGANKGQQVIIIRPSPQMSKNLQQSSIQKNKILKDRQKLIEAVLVKALKHSHATGDNSISFSQLYKVIKDHHVLGGFNFSQAVVKQRLQQLIAREYCVRDEQDRKIYHYVA